MKILDKRDMGIIYAIKTNKKNSVEDSIIDFMCKYSGSTPDVYNTNTIRCLVEHAFAAAMDMVEYPSAYISSFFRWKAGPWHYTDIEAMCAVLGAELQVKQLNHETNKYEYINGFSKMDEFGFE